MKTIECTGKTVEEALDIALKQLGVSKEKVDYTITDEGSRGFLNLIGAKPAKIRVTLKRNAIEEGKIFLEDILKKMGLEATVVIKEEEDKVNINIVGDNTASIIGYRGETLDSIQYLTSLVVNKNNKGSYKRIILDTKNYRAKREETLKTVANKTAYKVKKYGRTLKLEPMNPYERRIIHSTLQADKLIFTYSEGEEPFRRVVIELKNKKEA